ncbi:MAG: TonB-dependent siderophore receptor [Pseudomonadales bacterium]|nr:TonB-dependent siderophore receptor [Pseudomonadales bacterium]
MSFMPSAVATGGEIDSDNPSEQLDRITVHGEAYRSTGTKTQLKPIEAPMSYEVYDAELLKKRQVDSVNKALRYVPGVTPESRATVTIFDQYYIRGFESYRNFYDGLALLQVPGWNLGPQVDIFATESVEVLKGPTSVLYGSAPPGGMINQTAKQPLSTSRTTLQLRAGSHSLQEFALDSTGAVSDSVNMRVVALARAKDGQQVTTEEERQLVAPSMTWQISDKTSLNLNAYYQNDPKMVPSTPLPSIGARYEAPYGKLDADAFAGDAKWAGFEREVTMVGYKINHQFTDGLSFLQNFRYTKANALQKNSYNYGLAADQRTLVRTFYLTDEDLEGIAVDNQLASDFQFGESQHNLLLGVDYRKAKGDVYYGDTYGLNHSPALDLSDPDHYQVDEDSLILYPYTLDLRESQLGFYIQDEFSIGKMTWVAGLRRDTYRSKDYDNGTEIDQSETSGRLAVIYQLGNGIAPYINYSESFEPQSGMDTATQKAFEPTTAKQYEAGIKYQDQARSITFTAAYFDLRKQDVVVNNIDWSQRRQAGEVRSEGVELQFESLISESLSVMASYSYMDVKVTEDELQPNLEGKTPVWVADQTASVWLDFLATDALTVSGGARYVGKQEINKENEDYVPSYMLYDAALSYDIDETYNVGLSVNNLTDKRYVGACYDTNNCWMGAERTTELSLSATF